MMEEKEIEMQRRKRIEDIYKNTKCKIKGEEKITQKFATKKEVSFSDDN